MDDNWIVNKETRADKDKESAEIERQSLEFFKDGGTTQKGSPLYTRDEYKGLSSKEKESAGIYLTRISYGKKWD